jgi:Chaperone of endosialidase
MAYSNTYIEPTNGTALNTARIQQNDTFRAIATNFLSTSPPAGTNFTIAGEPTTVPDGVLYRSATTNALYIQDSVNFKNAPVGGNFTRWGIGHRVEPNIASLTSNKTTYEIGELVATLDTGRLYFRNSNTDSIASFTQIGSIQGYTMGALDNVTFTGQSVSAITFLATSNVGINTNSPTQALDIVGSAQISGNAYVGNYVYHKDDINTYIGFPINDTFVVNTNGSEKVRVDLTGNLGIGTTTAKAKLEVVGNTAITSSLSALTVATTNVAVGTGQGSLYLNSNQINNIDYNGLSEIAINYVGYNAGTTQFRDFKVYNGKTAAIATFTGSTGDLTASGNITATSDERVKSNIRTIDNALDKVCKLRGVYFDKDDRASTGVIAQEVERVLPEVVTDGEYKSVAYGNMVGLLIESIKDLKAEIDLLKKDR